MSSAQSTPTFSIVTPTYNCAEFIERCYFCLIRQSFSDWEWIVVDDGSTDNTFEILQALGDPRVRPIRYEKNQGRGYARALTLKESRGKWLVIWDVDDVYFPDRLAQINQARQEGYEFACSYALLLNTRLEEKGLRTYVLDESCTTKVFTHPTMACDMSLAQSIGYDATLRAGEDAEFIWTLARKRHGKWIADTLTGYVEDREVNLKKSITSNIGQFRIARNLYRRNILDIGFAQYARLVGRWSLKILALNALRVKPSLYLKSVQQRSQGEAPTDWELSQEKQQFLDELRRRNDDNDWSCEFAVPTDASNII